MNLMNIFRSTPARAQVKRIATWVEKEPSALKELINVFIAGDIRVQQRAAAPLAMLAQTNPEALKPYVRQLIDHYQKPTTSVGHRRNIIRMLQHTDIPKAMHGRVYEVGFATLTDTKEAIAIRAFAMTLIARIALENPGLQGELSIAIEDAMVHGSAAIKNRGSKLLKQLKG